MKIGVIGLKDKWSSEQLCTELKELGVETALIEMKDVAFDLTQDKITYQSLDLTTFDAFIIKKLGKNYSPYLYDRLEVLDYLWQKKGMNFFPTPDKIRRLLSRYSCTRELIQGGVEMPETFITENPEAALNKLEEIKDVIIKPLFTSKSRGMIKLNSAEHGMKELKEFHKEFKTIYMQKVVQHPGYDLGVCFLGKEYIGTYARVGNSEGWNTTTQKGGHYEAKEVNEEILALAEKARDIFNLDFTCVDVVETQDGPKVFEVSAFGGFRGLKESAGLNLAQMYAEYVVKCIKESK